MGGLKVTNQEKQNTQATVLAPLTGKAVLLIEV